MARLFSSGFEMNTTGNDIEWTNVNNGPIIVNSPVRSGTYAGRIPNLGSGADKWWQKKFAVADQSVDLFTRFYLYVTTRPNVNTTIFSYINDSGTQTVSLDLLTDGTLQLYYNSAGNLVGTTTTALNSNQWYMIEVKQGVTNTVAELRIDGVVSLTSASATGQSASNTIRLGGNIFVQSTTIIDIAFDDVAVNDSSGSFQTDYPGKGSIIHLLPAMPGDINTFATATGGTAGAAFNYTRVREVTPDDATTLNGSNTLNQEDLFAMTQVQAIGTVAVVQVGARFRNNIADAATTLKLELEKTQAGTILQSAAITPNSTTWFTNATGVPFAYPINAYQDPDAGTWTRNTINSLRAGYKITTGGTNRVEVTKLWVLLEADYIQPLPLPKTFFKGTRPHPFSPGLAR